MSDTNMLAAEDQDLFAAGWRKRLTRCVYYLTLPVLLAACTDNGSMFGRDAAPQRAPDAKVDAAKIPVGISIALDAEPRWAARKRECERRGGVFQLLDAGAAACHRRIDGGR